MFALFYIIFCICPRLRSHTCYICLSKWKGMIWSSKSSQHIHAFPLNLGYFVSPTTTPLSNFSGLHPLESGKFGLPSPAGKENLVYIPLALENYPPQQEHAPLIPYWDKYHIKRKIPILVQRVSNFNIIITFRLTSMRFTPFIQTKRRLIHELFYILIMQ